MSENSTEDKKSFSLTVRLLKEDFSLEGNSYKMALKNGFGLMDPVINSNNLIGYLYKSRDLCVPVWAEYLDLEEDLSHQGPPSFLLFSFVGKRTVVYSFGHSYRLLEEYSLESDFGIQTTLNMVDAKKLKSIDVFTPIKSTKQRREVSSLASNVYDYTFNEDSDFIQKLSGFIKNDYKDFINSISGSDSLNITTYKKKEELNELSKLLVNRYLSEDYKSNNLLKNINKIKKIKSKDKIEYLDSLILNNQNSIMLSDYDILDFDDFSHYSYQRTKYNDLELLKEDLLSDDYLNSNKYNICMNFKDDKKEKRVPLYKFLSLNINDSGNEYYLSKGAWYKIDSNFVKSVDTFIKRYLERTNPLIDYKSIYSDQVGIIGEVNSEGKERQEKGEGLYNHIVSKSNSKYILFDKKCVSLEGYDKIELCDIYDKDENIFYHIKRKTESSSLSHLWNQGVAPEKLINSGSEKTLTKFKEVSGLDNIRDDRKIAYGIISNKKDIPIFSKISLYNTIKSLKDLGVKDTNISWFFIPVIEDEFDIFESSMFN